MAVLGEKKIVILMTVTAEPEMFYLCLAPSPMSSADNPAIAKVVKLLAALRIHTLGYHAGPLGVLR